MEEVEIIEICEKVYDSETKSVLLEGEFDVDSLESIVKWMKKQH